MTRLWLATLLVVSCTGCGLHILDSVENLPVPPSLRERTLWKDTAILQYRLDGLSGYVLSRPSADADWKREQQILPDGFSNVPKPIADGAFYHSIVSADASGSGSAQIPVLSVAGSLKTNQRMELTITDAALIYVPDKSIPWTQLETYMTAHPAPAGTSRVWVQAVMLTKMLYTVATKTKANATVSGTAFKTDGSVYNSNSTMQRQAYLTMLLVDLGSLDKKVKEAGGLKELTHPEDRSVVFSAKEVRWVSTEAGAIR